MTNTRVCSRCGQRKSLTAFYFQFGRSRGQCKECFNQSVTEYRKTGHGRAVYRRIRQRYRATENAKAKHVGHIKRQWHRYPERMSARLAVTHALQSGRLRKLPCAVCGSKRVHAHHPDYSRKLDVVWLCSRHHREHHIEIGK